MGNATDAFLAGVQGRTPAHSRINPPERNTPPQVIWDRPPQYPKKTPDTLFSACCYSGGDIHCYWRKKDGWHGECMVKWDMHTVPEILIAAIMETMK